MKMAGIVWRRAAPTLKIEDPQFEEKRLTIKLALVQEQPEHPFIYQNEVDIDLNPKIGADWMRKGHQKRIATPGQIQNITWPGRCILALEKSTTLAAAVRVLNYLSASQSHCDVHTGGRKPLRWLLITTSFIKAAR